MRKCNFYTIIFVISKNFISRRKIMFKVGSIFIPVTDIEKSTDWYVKFLGVKIIDSWGEGAGFYLPTGTAQLALVKVESPQPTEFIIQGDRKNSYFNFVVDDM